MRSTINTLRILILATGSSVFAQGSGDFASNWPQWRGPQATGFAPHADPPVEWSESKNIRWKVPIPGRGHASPIVWADRVYIQTAIETDKQIKAEGADAQPEPPGPPGRGRAPKPTKVCQFAVLALDRATGKTVWQKVVKEAVPHEAGHQDASQASNSPITDGQRVYAFFGSRGLYALDRDGKVLWEKHFGEMKTRMGFGEGSSPALVGDLLIVNWDHEGEDFIVALDCKTGQEKWRKPRDENTTWATPLVVEHAGKPQIITTATKRIRA